MRQYMFWNRELSQEQGKYSHLLEFSPESLQTEAKILSLAEAGDPADEGLHTGSQLPAGASLLGIGTTVDDFSKIAALRDNPPNVLFVSPTCPHAATVLPQILQAYPSITWVHCRSAGIDFVESDDLVTITEERGIRVTNAKGQFSSSLAEYVVMACSYFAKDLPRLMAQKEKRQWIKYDVQELRGKTLGIIGYGDIGRAVAKLGSVFGMRVVALRRHPFLSRNDPYCNKVYDRSAASRNKLMAESDYIVCSAPSTVETRGMINAEALQAVKPGAVFINLGRGPVVDDAALIQALKDGKLRGAALDVFSEEPLPKESEYWDSPNLLISPHNMDQTSTFMNEATEYV
jgi:phosphoglycerate dehydrogenase-like enzyme